MSKESLKRKLNNKVKRLSSDSNLIQFATWRGVKRTTTTGSGKNKSILDEVASSSSYIQDASTIARGANSSSRAVKNIISAAADGQRIFENHKRSRSGLGKLERALGVAGKALTLAHTGAKTGRSAALAVKTLADISNSKKNLQLKEAELNTKSQEVQDKSRRTDLWEKSLNQIESKKPFLKKQLALKEKQLSLKEQKENIKDTEKAAGRVLVKGYTRKGRKVKSFTRKKPSRTRRGK